MCSQTLVRYSRTLHYSQDIVIFDLIHDVAFNNDFETCSLPEDCQRLYHFVKDNLIGTTGS